MTSAATARSKGAQYGFGLVNNTFLVYLRCVFVHFSEKWRLLLIVFVMGPPQQCSRYIGMFLCVIMLYFYLVCTVSFPILVYVASFFRGAKFHVCLDDVSVRAGNIQGWPHDSAPLNSSWTQIAPPSGIFHHSLVLFVHISSLYMSTCVILQIVLLSTSCYTATAKTCGLF